jgi:serine/threonine protein kinase
MENPECPTHTDLTRMATGVLHAHLQEVREHLDSCEKCSGTLAEITQQTAWLECRLARLTLDDVEAAGVMLQAERVLESTNSDGWLSPESYELAQQTALFSTPCRVGQYELHGLIAPGGMGEVYKATHSRLKREVAVKVIRRNQQDSPLFYENFLREIETLGQLEHPNMVRAYDALEYEGYLFLVMELLTGVSLQSQARKDQLSTVDQLLDVMIGVSEAILHLHGNGYLHLDIKPANIMLLENGVTKLIDYGLAIRQDAVTSSGGVHYGTVGYMSPEQQDAGRVDQRSDIFAAGKLFLFLLARASDKASINDASLVKCEVQALADKMIAHDPAGRPQNAAEVLHTLQNIKQTLRTQSGNPTSLDHSLTTTAATGMRRTSAVLRRYSVLFLLAVFVLLFLFRWIVSDPSQGDSSSLGDLTNDIGMQLNVVSEGQFQMNTACQINGEKYFVSQVVAIKQPFYIGVYEVTQQQYSEVMGENPSHFNGDNMPVENLTFADAIEFCRRLSERPVEKNAGRVYRIPTTIEWEYACRSGTTTTFSFGEEDWLINQHAWYRGNAGSSHVVGAKRANAWGLYDMHGNVSEFCLLGDLWDSVLPDGEKSNVDWGWCGGSWAGSASGCRSGLCEVAADQQRRVSSHGLRVVCNLLPQKNVGDEASNQPATELHSTILDLRGEPEPAPFRTTNAVLYREEDDTHYWTPEKLNEWAEVEYRLELPAPIESIIDFGQFIWVYNEHYFPVFDPLAQGTFEISRDGKLWHVVFHSESGVPLVDRRRSVLPLLKGTQVVYLRARLFCSVRGKEVCFSQFLRCSINEEPHQLQFLLRSDGSAAELKAPIAESVSGETDAFSE